MDMPAGDSKLELTEDGEVLVVLVDLLLKPSLPQWFFSCLLGSILHLACNDCGCYILKCVELGVQRILPHDVSHGLVCHINVLIQLLVLPHTLESPPVLDDELVGKFEKVLFSLNFPGAGESDRMMMTFVFDVIASGGDRSSGWCMRAAVCLGRASRRATAAGRAC
ncbi:hypothetical protein DPX16_17351 [Anabarilius grahami]|uniref:Uncharacterized protein n=1 Tax=Anabarilius grahami TaxID=495550 RepID=A0A3N0XYQ5_ANAGA|nr:hypothetical protein DPX16_17351 [Anabarilius grahami]